MAQAGLTGGPKGGFGAKQVSDTCLEMWNKLTKEIRRSVGTLKQKIHVNFLHYKFSESKAFRLKKVEVVKICMKKCPSVSFFAS